ncbi:MAG TPA: response regulator [Thermoanaerobaculia bacterium]|nr:response regulator [Thermoanaerobaculia bacterium]
MTRKILLADDSLTIQKVVELTFSDSEYDLVCVSNGQRALDRISGGDIPDLILADVVMPEKNGYEVCEAIKANPSTARVPVVLLSGTFEPFDRERAERLGCDAIVSKPFDSQQLLRQVEALLSRPPAEVPVTATVAIPTMPNPVPPVALALEPPAAPAGEAGFRQEDFTGSIRVPAQVAGGADMFEEEYGQADVESAIAAFEKAHPEFTYSEDGDTATEAIPGDVAPTPRADEPHEESRAAGWLDEEPEAPAPAPVVAAPAPFWVPREPEPDVAPIPFAADDTAPRRPTGAATIPAASMAPVSSAFEPMRADEAPTQQIPLAAEYAALSRNTDFAPERDTDPTHPRRSAEAPKPDEPKAEVPALRDELLAAAPEPVPPATSEAAEPGPVPPEIEELAQTTSIGQLKEMLSSVSRPEGGLSDDDIDRLASRVVERLSERIVREIAWEVIPDVAELVIKQRIKELEAGVE